MQRIFFIACVLDAATAITTSEQYELFGITAPTYTSKAAMSLERMSLRTGVSQLVHKLTAPHKDAADPLQGEFAVHSPSSTAVFAALKKDLSGSTLYAVDAQSAAQKAKIDVAGGVPHMALYETGAKNGAPPMVVGINVVNGVPRLFSAPALSLSTAQFYASPVLPGGYFKEGLSTFCGSTYMYAAGGAIVAIDVAAATGGAGNASATFTKCTAADDLASLSADCADGKLQALYGMRQTAKGTDLVRLGLNNDMCSVDSLANVDGQYDVAVPSVVLDGGYVAVLVNQSGWPHLASLSIGQSEALASNSKSGSSIVPVNFAPIAFVRNAASAGPVGP